jgi:hypothetical protein
MDTFLIKRSAESESQESIAQVMKKFKTVRRQYSEAYLYFGFTWGDNSACSSPVCVEKISNQSTVPSKLKWYLSTKHSRMIGKKCRLFSTAVGTRQITNKINVFRCEIFPEISDS